MIVCTLINGCGLFKNTKKDLRLVKSGVEVEVKKEGEVKSEDRSTSTESKSSDKMESSNNDYQVEADEIIINPDGSITAKGKAKAKGKASGNKSEKIEESKEVKRDVKVAAKVSEQGKATAETYDKDFHEESKTSGKAIIYGAIGVLIVVLGLRMFITKVKI